MKINDSKFSDEKLDVNAENVLNCIPEYNIYANYVGEFVIGRTFKSPLREKDDHPSFGIYWSKTNENKLLFNDLATGIHGDCFNLVMNVFNVSYNNALLKIIFDFRINELFKIRDNVIITPQKNIPKILDRSDLPVREEVIIQIRVRDWERRDKMFWGAYGITFDTLKKYYVHPISHIFLNEKIITADKYAYAYHEQKDGINRYKIYQPYSKNMKWLSNFIEATLSGWTQMPDKANALIITSSLKDVMTLTELGFNSMSPQTETYSFKDHIVKILYNRFDKIYIFYDYDKTGITNTYNAVRRYGFIPIFTKSTKFKDPSDFVRQYGKDAALKTFKLNN